MSEQVQAETSAPVKRTPKRSPEQMVLHHADAAMTSLQNVGALLWKTGQTNLFDDLHKVTDALNALQEKL